NTHFVSYDYKLFRYDTMYSNENAKSVRMENDRIFSWRGDSLEIIVKK
ncbi:MAG: hypothetical protein ACI9UJ_001446, partial [bacterium]